MKAFLAAMLMLIGMAGAWPGPEAAERLVFGPSVASSPASVRAAGPVKVARTPHVTAELLPETAGAAPGGTVHIALRQVIKPGWHTYWRNPGDSGEPTEVRWTLPPGWSAGPIVWPAPERQAIGPEGSQLVNYGYEREVLLPVPITVPADARPGETVRLSARAFWLVCEQVCVPEQAELWVDLPVAAGRPAPHPQHGRAVARTLAEAPKPSGLEATTRIENGRLKLAVVGAPLRQAELAGAWFYPYSGSVIDHAEPQTVDRGPEGLTLSMAPSPGVQADGAPETVEGVLVAGGRAWEVAAESGPGLAGASGLGAPRGPAGELSLPLAIGLALLGGLVLNLMPCVFPVLGMKAAGLAGHAHEPRAAQLHGAAFGAGVLTTFLALAGVLLALRAAGEAAGWGFQLQSPGVVAGLALLMLLVGMNLSGAFHLGGSVQNAGAELASRRGLAGAFFTGALAVVVAAPCTAPFMGLAIGWAVTQAPAVALAVFAALALGFAAPFVALSFAPGLLRRLPRPGPWMGRLRRWLAAPMYAAAAWLGWVYWRQTDRGWELVVLAGVLAALGWLWGHRQRRGERAPWAPVAAAVVLAALPISNLIQGGRRTAPVGGGPVMASQAWSPTRVAALRAEGRPVFVNFTADWCVTCKVNERAALADRGVAEAFKRSGVVHLTADWTRRDGVIAAALAEQGRSGVPLYLLYPAGGGAPVVLPQLLTPGALVRALEGAGGARASGPSGSLPARPEA
ncbi:MAG: thioredoxin family protein [Proteobacteria bacterium]|nr:thioredoxin family protein [Pseudomonadota bacterium]